MAGAEGLDLVFGNANHLPGHEVLEGLDWKDHIPEHKQLIIPPDSPDVVVRQHYRYSRAERFAAIAQLGIEHFTRLEDVGIVVPPQRFFVGPDPDVPTQPRLYSTTDYIEGRPLRHSPQDATHAKPLIEGYAHYLGGVYEDILDDYLYDIPYGHQHALRSTGSVCLRDLDLLFDSIRSEDKRPSDKFIYSCLWLKEWANRANLDPPERVLQLVHKMKQYNPFVQAIVTCRPTTTEDTKAKDPVASLINKITAAFKKL